MNNSHPSALAAPAAKRALPLFKKYFSAGIVLGLLLTLSVARVEGQDDDYLAVYGMIGQADALNTGGKTVAAHNKYIEAKRALVAFQQSYPGWDKTTVNFRMKYLDDQIAATTMSVAAPATSTSATVSKSAMSGGPSPVKLLDAGSEPRKILSLHPTVGDKQTMNMTLKMGMDMSAGGSQMPAMKLPAMQMTMALTVKEISATGETTYEVVLGDATVMADTNALPAIVTAMKTGLAGMQGITGTGRISSQGIVKDVKMKVPAGASPQLSQAMDQMKDSFSSASVALPSEAVGAGAKWQYKTKVKTQGMSIDQTVDYELVSIDGDQLTLRSTIHQNAANQKIESPAMPGMKVDLTKMTGTGSVNMTFDLGHIMPSSVTIDQDTEVTMGMGQPGQTMDMKMKMNIDLEAK